ncbi:MAG: 4Fe-4S binding protein [Anaerolineales bacterium]|nr:4Fe-4S binding protein [Anaerolineales bacterium]
MKIIIDQDLCQACGDCVEACPNEAITLNHDKVSIDQIRCTECQLCVDACPTGALSVSQPTAVKVIEKPRDIEVVTPQTVSVPATRQSTTSGSLLSLAGQYIFPRMVDVLANYLERRLTPSVKDQPTMGSHPISTPRGGRRMRRRGRYSRFSEERR